MIMARWVEHGKSCVSVGILWALRMLVASLRKSGWRIWSMNLVNDFDNDVGAKGGMIR